MGLHPRPRWESSQCSPNPITGFEGPTFKGREGNGREGKGRGGKKRTRGGRKKEGRGRIESWLWGMDAPVDSRAL